MSPTRFLLLGELYEDNTKMLMQNLGAQQPIMEEDEDEDIPPAKIDKNETDEEKKKRLLGNDVNYCLHLRLSKIETRVNVVKDNEIIEFAVV